jgi:hypothetical protein
VIPISARADEVFKEVRAGQDRQGGDGGGEDADGDGTPPR